MPMALHTRALEKHPTVLAPFQQSRKPFVVKQTGGPARLQASPTQLRPSRPEPFCVRRNAADFQGNNSTGALNPLKSNLLRSHPKSQHLEIPTERSGAPSRECHHASHTRETI